MVGKLLTYGLVELMEIQLLLKRQVYGIGNGTIQILKSRKIELNGEKVGEVMNQTMGKVEGTSID